MGLALLGTSIGKWLANPRVIAVLNFASGLVIVVFGIRGLVAAD
jgi:threonine/homoserine/homoserine lactone efflux protein